MNRTIRIVLANFLIFFATHSFAKFSTSDVFVHLFEWRWNDIASECENHLAKIGYSAVQVSPPQEHVEKEQWWSRYQPVSYSLNSRGGDREDFIDMVKRCKAVGVSIIVDAVINHMAANKGSGSDGSKFNSFLGDYPIFNKWDFHSPCLITNYNDRYQIQKCSLSGLPDLDTGSEYVQQTIANYLNDLTAIGVAGFRIDAAKHMNPQDLQAIKSKLEGDPFIFQEVIDMGHEAVSANEYYHIGSVTEFRYGANLGRVFRDGKLSWLQMFGEVWGMSPSDSSVVFIDNHDNQRGHGGGGSILTHRESHLYSLANIFMLAWPYGLPKVMSSFFFNDSDQGPPSGKVECYKDWACEHRWTSIKAMVGFRKKMGASRVENFWSNGNNLMAFSRGNLGFVIINKENYSVTRWFDTKLPQGSYCNIIKSDSTVCSEKVVVDRYGWAQIRVEPWDAVVLRR